MPLFSVIIVNFNGGEYPKRAIESLKAQTLQDFELLFVDNASDDGSVEMIDWNGLPAHKLFLENRNHGFAAANNLAAREANGTWLALLNPDAEAAPDWLEKLAEAISEWPRVSAFASAQYDMNDPERLDGVGDAYLVFGFPWRGGFGRPASELPAAGECFSPCGAGACIRKDVFLDHNGFDERFFCYCEDVDLGYRMRLSGENCRFVPQAIIHHAGGGLSGRASDFTVFHGTRNRIWVYAKNTPVALLLLTLPGHVAITTYLMARNIGSDRFTPTWRGIKAGLAGIRALRDDRRFGPPCRKVGLLELARSMAWNPWRMSGRRAHVRNVTEA